MTVKARKYSNIAKTHPEHNYVMVMKSPEYVEDRI